MIDRYSKADFEDALPRDKDTNAPLWTHYRFDKGEHTYLIPLKDTRVAILIRSSIEMNGRAAESGNDSIRILLINVATGSPLAEKVDAWTQRTHGWQHRMTEKIRILYKKGLEMANCPQCNDGVLTKREGKFGAFYGCSSYPRCKYTTNSLDAPKAPKVDPEPVTESESIDADVYFGAIFDELTDDEYNFGDDDVSLPANELDSDPFERLNPQQVEYVTAPIDANIRVMAAPGSGKTMSTVERIVYLLQHGVDPSALVYVTFTKAMADEGFERIARRVPEVVSTGLANQICTIHALCFRMLRWEGLKRDVPKEWEVKRALNEIVVGDDRKKIVGEWQAAFEKPGYKEVLHWINLAKSNGLTTTEDAAFFVRFMNHGHAQKVHNARRRYDEWLDANNYITFGDMLYLVEQRLIHDHAFRNKYQARFTHILVDECQDVSRQALFVLCVLSLDHKDREGYERMRKWRFGKDNPCKEQQTGE